MEIKASVLEVPIDVPACDEMAAYGAALGAGASLGWWPLPGGGDAGSWPVPAMTTVDPEPLPVYRTGLARFIELGDAAVARIT
jgi:sugar (pentulose or hexulose) kinase